MFGMIPGRQYIITVGLAVICVVAGFAAGWLLKPPETVEVQPPAPPPIKLGSVAPLTGPFASSGEEMKRGLEMAVNEINARGGILGRSVQLVLRDVEDMSPDKIISAFEDLCAKEKVDFIVYGWTVVYGPQWDICAKYGVPVLHVETVKEFEDWIKNHPNDRWLNFMADAPDTYYGIGFAKFLDILIAEGYYKPLNKKIAMMRGEDAYGQRICEVFKDEMLKRGWTVVIDETITFGTVEYTPILSRIRAESPDVIINTDLVPSDLVAFMKQFRENPTRSLFITAFGAAAPEFIQLGGPAVEGVIWTTMLGQLRGDPVREAWAEKYRTLYGEEPGEDAAFVYDMVQMWAIATAVAGTTEPKAVCKQLEKTIYRGNCGTYLFNEWHWSPGYPDTTDDPSLGLPHLFYQIQNQQNALIYPKPFNVSTFQLPPWF